MNILVVDDEELQVEVLQRGLQIRGHAVLGALNIEEALWQLQDNEIDIVLTDYLIGEETGLSLLKVIREQYGALPVILMTAYGEKKILVDALHYHCNGFIDKPFTLEVLMQEIAQVEQSLVKISKPEKQTEILPHLLHQINNPLAAILASAQLISKSKEEHRNIKKYINGITEGVMQIKEINLKIASLSQIENKKEKVSLKSVLDNSLNMFRDLFLLKQIHCVEERLYELDMTIIGSQFDLEQIFKNLILNAVDAMDGDLDKKFLTVSAKKNPDASSVSIRIKDTGCGIPNDRMDDVFTPCMSTKPHGTGLGLHIVRTIVENHKGSVCVESTLGMGSAFTVNLPVSDCR